MNPESLIIYSLYYFLYIQFNRTVTVTVISLENCNSESNDFLS